MLLPSDPHPRRRSASRPPSPTSRQVNDAPSLEAEQTSPRAWPTLSTQRIAAAGGLLELARRVGRTEAAVRLVRPAGPRLRAGRPADSGLTSRQPAFVPRCGEPSPSPASAPRGSEASASACAGACYADQACSTHSPSPSSSPPLASPVSEKGQVIAKAIYEGLEQVRAEIANLETRFIRWMVGTVIATATLTVGNPVSDQMGESDR